MTAINIGALLEPGLRAEASMVYMPIYQGVRAQIGECCYMELTSDKLQEVYGFLEAPLYFAWWPAETPPPAGTIKSQRWRILNFDFGRRVYLPRNVEDDQTGTAMTFAKAIAQTYGILPEEEFYQLITNSSYNSTTFPMPYNANAADGNALIITTSRYGRSGGNGVTLTSASTVQGVITDIFAGVRAFQDFQNTQSRPFFDATMTRTMSLFHGTAQTLVMNQAEFQVRTPWEQTSGVTGQTPTNLLRDAKLDIRFVPSQRITATQYFLILRGLPAPMRPIWRQVRKGYTEWQGNFITSDYSRDTGQVYVQGDCRESVVPGALAIAILRVQ